ncbi:MAG: zf-HC2 domain-containing protein [Proteobacteria bacterium]|nr:MAG: zf-HC2 domain-containing protein [Pseudomonadota bacterium]
MTEACPDHEALSALADGVLLASAEEGVRTHVARCPACAARLVELQALSEALRGLPRESLGFDLGARIESRLPARAQPTPQRRWRLGWRSLVPLAGAAAALVLGLRLGVSLVSAGPVQTAVLPAVQAMSVFDAVPPGNLCPRPHACLLVSVSR